MRSAWSSGSPEPSSCRTALDVEASSTSRRHPRASSAAVRSFQSTPTSTPEQRFGSWVVVFPLPGSLASPGLRPGSPPRRPVAPFSFLNFVPSFHPPPLRGVGGTERLGRSSRSTFFRSTLDRALARVLGHFRLGRSTPFHGFRFVWNVPLPFHPVFCVSLHRSNAPFAASQRCPAPGRQTKCRHFLRRPQAVRGAWCAFPWACGPGLSPVAPGVFSASAAPRPGRGFCRSPPAFSFTSQFVVHQLSPGHRLAFRRFAMCVRARFVRVRVTRSRVRPGAWASCCVRFSGSSFLAVASEGRGFLAARSSLRSRQPGCFRAAGPGGALQARGLRPHGGQRRGRPSLCSAPPGRQT